MLRHDHLDNRDDGTRGGKYRSIAMLLVAEFAAMSLWFVSAAILADMTRETTIEPWRQAALSSGVQLGFVVGAVTSAVLGIADRFDPRRVLLISTLAAAAINASLLVATPGGALSITARFLTGALLAGVYPVGMKIAVGWGLRDRGFLVGALVGALTLGSAVPHLISLMGGTNWRLSVVVASLAAAAGGLVVLAVQLGPHHARAATFDPRAIGAVWTNRRIRLAYAGYLGHMWELYAMWAWIATASAASYSAHLTAADAISFGKVTAFLAIAAGAVSCVVAGSIADRVGKAEIAAAAMIASGSAALLTAATFGGPPWLTFLLVLAWGATIVPDSAQFSALVADAAPPAAAGSLMTFQTALGFALTFVTVQVVPSAAVSLGWPLVLAALAIGPALGTIAMLRLRNA